MLFPSFHANFLHLTSDFLKITNSFSSRLFFSKTNRLIVLIRSSIRSPLFEKPLDKGECAVLYLRRNFFALFDLGKCFEVISIEDYWLDCGNPVIFLNLQYG